MALKKKKERKKNAHNFEIYFRRTRVINFSPGYTVMIDGLPVKGESSPRADITGPRERRANVVRSRRWGEKS